MVVSVCVCLYSFCCFPPIAMNNIRVTRSMWPCKIQHNSALVTDEVIRSTACPSGQCNMKAREETALVPWALWSLWRWDQRWGRTWANAKTLLQLIDSQRSRFLLHQDTQPYSHICLSKKFLSFLLYYTANLIETTEGDSDFPQWGLHPGNLGTAKVFSMS